MDREITREVHDFIKAQEQADGDLVRFTGYYGSGSGDNVILYTDRSTKMFYEIPDKEIVYEKPVEGGEGLVDVYVKNSTSIRLVIKGTALDMKKGKPEDLYGSGIEIMPGLWTIYGGCVGRCEKDYALKMADINTNDYLDPREKQLLKERYKAELRICLKGCFSKYKKPSYIIDYIFYDIIGYYENYRIVYPAPNPPVEVKFDPNIPGVGPYDRS